MYPIFVVKSNVLYVNKKSTKLTEFVFAAVGNNDFRRNGATFARLVLLQE